MKRRCLVLALLAAAVVAIPGCSKEPSLAGVIPASVIITQKGVPLEGAAVTFSPVAQDAGRAASGSPTGQNAGRAASGMTDANGRCKLTTLKAEDGALPGDYLVAVIKTKTVGKTYTQEEYREYYNKHKKSPPEPESQNLLADKYSRSGSSGFKATVKKGDKNEFPFDLE